MSQASIALIIFLLTLAMFIWQKFPAGLVAILGALAMMAFGVITPKQVVSPFGSDTVIMVASVLILGNAVFETGAAAKIGQTVMKFAGCSERLLVTILVIVVSILSAFLSNTAVVAIFIPLLASLAHSSQGRITKKGTYMAVGIASVIGGNCTLAGSTPQLTAQGILQSTDGVRELTFWELGKVGFPLVILLALYYFFIGTRIQDKVFNFSDVPDPQSAADAGCAKGKYWQQIIVLVIMMLCIIGFSTSVFSFGTVGAICACLCILTGCISFHRAFQTLDWNTICVLGGAMGISEALNTSGLMDQMAGWIVSAFGGPKASPVLMCVVLLIFAAVLGNAMSHTASAAIFTPLAISIGKNLGVDPIAFVVAVIIGCNLAFMTPIATPPLTMTLVGGYRFTDYAKVGFLYNILAIILAAVLIPLIYLA